MLVAIIQSEKARVNKEKSDKTMNGCREENVLGRRMDKF